MRETSIAAAGRAAQALRIGLITVSLTLFGCSHDDPNLPEVISSSEQGQHLQLKSDPQGAWQASFVVASELKREQVLQSLNEIQAHYQQLRPEIRVWAEPGLPSRTRFARQLADVLSQANLGKQVENVEPPAFAADIEGAVILRCKEADQDIAHQLLGALSPYLAGRVFLMFDDDTAAHEMQMYLLGMPWFDQQGQASFDAPESQ